jgi:phosphatidylglycerophosphate synthase
MQTLTALPSPSAFETRGEWEAALRRKVSGVPLIARTLVTATRNGASSLLVLLPPGCTEAELSRHIEAFRDKIAPLEVVPLQKPFDPNRAADWEALRQRLEPYFLWLPWNCVSDKRRLSRLLQASQRSGRGARFDWPRGNGQEKAEERTAGATAADEMPLVLEKASLYRRVGGEQNNGAILESHLVRDGLEPVPLRSCPGILVQRAEDASRAEKDLVRWSGKDWDGIYSNANRRLCRPFVRWLSKTPVTPNQVTLTGLLFVLLSGYAFAQGYHAAYALGGVLYFLSVQFDEIDGMLARVTFRDSPFGYLLEHYADFASYVVLYTGITIGLYRESGPFWLGVGAVLMTSMLLSILVVGHQRMLVTEAGKPEQHLIRFYNTLEQQSHNWVSRVAREVQFVMKKAPFAHHVLWFSVLGIIQVHYLISTLGAVLIWTMGLYYNRVFRAQKKQAVVLVPATERALPANQMDGES